MIDSQGVGKDIFVFFGFHDPCLVLYATCENARNPVIDGADNNESMTCRKGKYEKKKRMMFNVLSHGAVNRLICEAVLQAPRQLRAVVRVAPQEPDPPQDAPDHRQRKDLLQDQESLMTR